MLHFITPQRPRWRWIPRASDCSPRQRCGRKTETPLLILKRTKGNTGTDCIGTHANWWPSTSCMSVAQRLSHAGSYYRGPSRVLLSDFHTVASASAHCDLGSFHPGMGGMVPGIRFVRVSHIGHLFRRSSMQAA